MDALVTRPEWSNDAGLTAVEQVDSMARYLIEGRISLFERSIIIKAEVKDKGKTEFYIDANLVVTDVLLHDTLRIADSLAAQLVSDVINGLANKVRIGLPDEFKMTKGHQKFQYLSKELPILLQDGLTRQSQLSIIGQGIRDFNIARDTVSYNPYTNLKSGRLMRANYRVSGHYWEADSQLRIEAGCVCLETGESISSHGINVEEINVLNLEQAMAALALGMRNDIMQSLFRTSMGSVNTMAVVGLPPTPNTKETRERTLSIVKALSRKLKAVNMSQLDIVEDPGTVERFINETPDIWAMAAEMNVSRLATVQYEEDREGECTIDIDLYDSEKPYAKTMSESKTGSLHDIRAMLNFFVDEIFRALVVYYVVTGNKNVTDSSVLFGEYTWDTIESRSRYEKIPVRNVLRNHSVGLSYNRIRTSSSGPLEYFDNSSFTLQTFFPWTFYWHPRIPVLGTLKLDYEHCQLGPVLTWDWGNNTLEYIAHDTEVSVHMFTFFIATKYNLLPERSVNPYLGMGIGVLWLRRIPGEGFNFLHAPSDMTLGLTKTLGFEFKINRSMYFTVPTKFYCGLWKFQDYVYNDRHYNGGWQWGFNIGIGFQYAW